MADGEKKRGSRRARKRIKRVDEEGVREVVARRSGRIGPSDRGDKFPGRRGLVNAEIEQRMRGGAFRLPRPAEPSDAGTVIRPAKRQRLARAIAPGSPRSAQSGGKGIGSLRRPSDVVKTERGGKKRATSPRMKVEKRPEAPSRGMVGKKGMRNVVAVTKIGAGPTTRNLLSRPIGPRRRNKGGVPLAVGKPVATPPPALDDRKRRKRSPSDTRGR